MKTSDEFIIGAEGDTIERFGKKRKVECPSCLQTLTKRALKKHLVNCEAYQKLIKNERQCSVCEKTFETRSATNQHIGKDLYINGRNTPIDFIFEIRRWGGGSNNTPGLDRGRWYGLRLITQLKIFTSRSF